jgi:ribose transport system permease protein/inositol transport system permease protein
MEEAVQYQDQGQRKGLRIDWSSAGILAILGLMIVLFGTMNPVFLTPQNIGNILRQISIVGICSVGLTAVVLTAGMDLSVGSVIGLSAVIGAMLMSTGVPIWIAVIIVLVIGVAAGLFNAFCVAVVRIPPLVTTLGTWIAWRGLIYVITGGRSVYGIPPSFNVIGQGDIFMLPVSAVFMIVAFVLGYLALEKTVFGRRIYSIGGNVEGARLSGIRVKRELTKVYVNSAVLASIAGLVLMSKVNSGQPSAGAGYELDTVTAVLLGGVSVYGGEGRILKVVVGVVFMGVLANGMMMLNVGEYQQQLVKGLILLLAVGMDIMTKSYNEEKQKRAEAAKRIAAASRQSQAGGEA